MTIRRKIEANIKKKEEEIQRLRDELRAAEAYVQALQDTLRQLPKEGSGTEGEITLREGSVVAKTLEVLKKSKKPMYVGDILTALGKEITKETRASLSGSLGAYVRDRKIFTRPKPNVFGLIEWEQPEDLEEIEELPDDFGIAR